MRSWCFMDIKDLISRQKEDKNLVIIIDSFLSKNPPFRNNTTFQEDINSYETLIDFYLLTGDENFIIDWGVKPLHYGYDLLYSKDYGKYREWFLKRSNESGDNSRKVCYRKLFELFDELVRIKKV